MADATIPPPGTTSTTAGVLGGAVLTSKPATVPQPTAAPAKATTTASPTTTVSSGSLSPASSIFSSSSASEETSAGSSGPAPAAPQGSGGYFLPNSTPSGTFFGGGGSGGGGNGGGGQTVSSQTTTPTSTPVSATTPSSTGAGISGPNGNLTVGSNGIVYNQYGTPLYTSNPNQTLSFVNGVPVATGGQQQQSVSSSLSNYVAPSSLASLPTPEPLSNSVAVKPIPSPSENAGQLGTLAGSNAFYAQQNANSANNAPIEAPVYPSFGVGSSIDDANKFYQEQAALGNVVPGNEGNPGQPLTYEQTTALANLYNQNHGLPSFSAQAFQPGYYNVNGKSTYITSQDQLDALAPTFAATSTPSTLPPAVPITAPIAIRASIDPKAYVKYGIAHAPTNPTILLPAGWSIIGGDLKVFGNNPTVDEAREYANALVNYSTLPGAQSGSKASTSKTTVPNWYEILQLDPNSAPSLANLAAVVGLTPKTFSQSTFEQSLGSLVPSISPAQTALLEAGSQSEPSTLSGISSYVSQLLNGVGSGIINPYINAVQSSRAQNLAFGQNLANVTGPNANPYVTRAFNNLYGGLNYLGNVARATPVLGNEANFIIGQPQVQAALQAGATPEELALGLGSAGIEGIGAGLATGYTLGTVPEVLLLSGGAGALLRTGIGAYEGQTTPYEIGQNLVGGAKSGATYGAISGGLAKALPSYLPELYKNIVLNLGIANAQSLLSNRVPATFEQNVFAGGLPLVFDAAGRVVAIRTYQPNEEASATGIVTRPLGQDIPILSFTKEYAPELAGLSEDEQQSLLASNPDYVPQFEYRLQVGTPYFKDPGSIAASDFLEKNANLVTTDYANKVVQKTLDVASQNGVIDPEIADYYKSTFGQVLAALKSAKTIEAPSEINLNLDKESYTPEEAAAAKQVLLDWQAKYEVYGTGSANIDLAKYADQLGALFRGSHDLDIKQIDILSADPAVDAEQGAATLTKLTGEQWEATNPKEGSWIIERVSDGQKLFDIHPGDNSQLADEDTLPETEFGMKHSPAVKVEGVPIAPLQNTILDKAFSGLTIRQDPQTGDIQVAPSEIRNTIDKSDLADLYALMRATAVITGGDPRVVDLQAAKAIELGFMPEGAYEVAKADPSLFNNALTVIQSDPVLAQSIATSSFQASPSLQSSLNSLGISPSPSPSISPSLSTSTSTSPSSSLSPSPQFSPSLSLSPSPSISPSLSLSTSSSESPSVSASPSESPSLSPSLSVSPSPSPSLSPSASPSPSPSPSPYGSPSFYPEEQSLSAGEKKFRKLVPRRLKYLRSSTQYTPSIITSLFPRSAPVVAGGVNNPNAADLGLAARLPEVIPRARRSQLSEPAQSFALA